MSGKHSRLFFTFVIVAILLSFVRPAPEDENYQLFISMNDIPNMTPQPINIDPENTKRLDLKPLQLAGGIGDRVVVNNTGKSAEVIFPQSENSLELFGGVLEGTYKLEKIRFYWASDPNEVAGSTVNNEGIPLEPVMMFFAEKYESFLNALSYRDGIAQLHFGVQTNGKNDDDLFGRLGSRLKKIQTPGSNQKMLAGQSFNWFTSSVASPNLTYFAYPGAYTDQQTGEVYYCSTTIVLIVPAINRAVSLSPDQFEDTFLSLEDAERSPLTNMVEQFPREVPVALAKGFIITLSDQ